MLLYETIHIFVLLLCQSGCSYRKSKYNKRRSAQCPSRVEKIPVPDPHQRIQVFLTQNLLPKLSEIKSGNFIPDPDFFRPGSRGNKSTGSQIPDPGPQ
jgi:hypothetical protein